MADDAKGKGPLSEEALQEMVASNDGGARDPTGAVALLIAVVAVVWSLYQVLLASPLANYVLPGDLINNSRQIHLAFAIFLAFMAYPAFPKDRSKSFYVLDWIKPVLVIGILWFLFFVITTSGVTFFRLPDWILENTLEVHISIAVILLLVLYFSFGPAPRD